MNVSIAIPCSISHVKFLVKAMDEIVRGSLLPNEVLIAISPVVMEENEILSSLEKYKIYFPVKVIFSKSKLNAALSRDILSEHITGDIVIYQDADDYQHRQRVEIVKGLFEEHDIVHLCHSFNFVSEGSYGNIQYESLRIVDGKSIYDKVFCDKFSDTVVDGAFGNKSTVQRIAAGATCIKKEVLDTIKWRDFSYSNCEDYWFCTKVF
jgi:hypothetical protein